MLSIIPASSRIRLKLRGCVLPEPQQLQPKLQIIAAQSILQYLVVFCQAGIQLRRLCKRHGAHAGRQIPAADDCGKQEAAPQCTRICKLCVGSCYHASQSSDVMWALEESKHSPKQVNVMDDFCMYMHNSRWLVPLPKQLQLCCGLWQS